jgi:hypothetical protein
MKRLFALFFLGFSLTTFGQNNPPVAVDDTLIFYYDEFHGRDSIRIGSSEWIKNDYDPDGNTIVIDTAWISGTNFISVFEVNGSVLWIYYHVPNNFVGLDSFQYALKDNGSPNLYDTGTVYIKVMPPLHAMLDANNILARVDKFSLFSKFYGIPGFEAPKGSGIHSIFSANLWVAGKNNNIVHSSVKRYGWIIGFKNYGSNSGPVSNLSSQYVEFNEKWDRVWKVKQYEIDYHLANWNSSNYSPPQSLVDWPAHGDPNLGEAFNLAPFFDNNQDGFYDPYDGDYPIIKGDQAIYFIYNDGGSTFSQNPMISEVHGMAYAFQCQDSALQNTIFVDYRIINRSNNTYDSTHFGMWTETDLGYAGDDYLQCDVDRSLFFTYNGDDFDEDNAGRPGYGSHPAAQGILTLKGAKQDNDGQDNAFGIGPNQSVNGIGFGDGVADNEYWGMSGFVYYHRSNWEQGVPTIDFEFYNYLTGKWKDNSQMRYGGSGHYASGGATDTIAKFMFPDLSDTYFYGTGGVPMPPWTEITAGNVPYDRRGVSSSGPVTFAPGDEIELTYAFVFGRDYVNMGAQAGVANMLERADSIRSYFNQGALGACGFPLSTGNSIEKEKETLIYPNPATDVITIEMGNTEPATIEILDITGKVVWMRSGGAPQTTIDISTLPNGVYLVRVRSASQMEVQKIIKQ